VRHFVLRAAACNRSCGGAKLKKGGLQESRQRRQCSVTVARSDVRGPGRLWLDAPL